MKRKLAGLLCCLILIITAGVSTAAAGNVTFIAAEENVLPLSEGQPVWSGGYLYIPTTVFTGMAKKSIDIGYVFSKTQQQAILTSRHMSLFFTLNESYCTDTEGGYHYPGAIVRNDTVYVPVSVVTEYFKLQYSMTDVPHGHLLWLRYPGFGLNEREFANAATTVMESRYQEYNRPSAPAGEGGQSTAQTPNTPAAQEPAPENKGKNVYLCFKASDRTQSLLDAMDAANTQAAIFCSADFIQENPGLVRRMLVTGHSVGICLDGAADLAVSEQLQAARDALRSATCGSTRLVLVENGAETDISALREAGCSVVRPRLDRSGYQLESGGDAEVLLARVTSMNGAVSVWLGERVNGIGLRSFLRQARAVEDKLLPLTEISAES